MAGAGHGLRRTYEIPAHHHGSRVIRCRAVGGLWDHLAAAAWQVEASPALVPLSTGVGERGGGNSGGGTG